MNEIWLLKVLVGSRAHGLHTETSDYDYRGVFAWPTRTLVGLGPKQRDTLWIAGESGVVGKEDATAWELGHFMHLATQCNPTILEVFAAPVIDLPTDEWGHSMRGMFKYIWDPQRVRDAFIGYGLNQRKKLLERKDDRPNKYAVAYLRVLCQAHHLLRTGELLVDFRGHAEYERLRNWRQGQYTPGEVVDTCMYWQRLVEVSAADCKQKPELERVSDWLVMVREVLW